MLVRASLPSAAFLAALLFAGCSHNHQASLTPIRFDPSMLGAPSEGNAGPTLNLAATGQNTEGSPIQDFMYFVPLTSPQPVSLLISPGNSQRTRIQPSVRQIKGNTFSVTCEFEIHGEGFLRQKFDNSENIRRAAEKLRAGGALERQLDIITVSGGGKGVIEVEGDISNQVARVTEVRLRFNTRGTPTPVTIGVADIREVNGAIRTTNEHLAQVHTLTFRASTSAVPRMHVSVGSVQRKDATGGLWQRFSGAVAGMAANMFLKPARIDPDGHSAMLRFGAHLAAGRTSFTFPLARHLVQGSAPSQETVSPPK